jgi:phosphatidylglycerophosphatase A
VLLARFWLSLFGVGYLKPGPGTWGSIAATLLWWSSLSSLGMAPQLLIFFMFALVSTWICANFSRDSGLGDESWIVVDEFAAMLFILAFLPRDVFLVLLALSMFRLFDIWKPWLVGLVDRKIHGGVGVMLDDLIAALFVLAIILPLIQVVPEGLILATYGLSQ